MQFLLFIFMLGALGTSCKHQDSVRPINRGDNSGQIGQQQGENPGGMQGGGTGDKTPSGTQQINQGGIEQPGGGAQSVGLKGPPVPDGDPDLVQYSQVHPAFVSAIRNDFKNNVAFSCPGDSVLYGESSVFDVQGASKDRQYGFQCQFMEDGQGVPLRKASCSWSEEQKGKNIDFSCPQGKFLAGQRSSYNAQAKDRKYQYQCCELRNIEGKKAGVSTGMMEDGSSITMCSNDEQRVPTQLQDLESFQQLVNIDVNDRLQPVSYNCANAALLPLGGLTVNLEVIPIENAVLHQVKSRLLPESFDRRHSFYCCQLTIKD